MTENRFKQVLILAALVVFLVWVFMLVHSVRLEERATVSRGFMIDNAGEIVQIQERVWELGKGERAPTQEEHDHAER